jgi:hypothetical protein
MSDRREQQAADRLLRETFRGVARPAPSLHFDRRLNEALAEERRRRRIARRAARLMQAYWLVAGAASLLIVLSLPWSESPSGARIPLMILALVALLPAVLARTDLLDLILGTSRRLGDRPDSLDSPPA